MGRPLYTARLTRRLLLSERADCFHLEFTIEELEKFDFQPGQFVSAVAVDAAGKQQTRAYSIASAPRVNQFDVCVNRVEGGFFSNLLCDLEVGQSLEFHGPHGLFLLRAPLTDSIFIATGTGIAPMRGFVEHLFPEDGEDLHALMRCADIAMYAAKEAQTDYKVYAAEQNQHSVRRLSVLSDIRHALISDEIVVHYQPIVDLDDLSVTGAEGLVRWQHPKMGLIPPGAFVQTVEQTGLIGPLTW